MGQLRSLRAPLAQPRAPNLLPKRPPPPSPLICTRPGAPNNFSAHRPNASRPASRFCPRVRVPGARRRAGAPVSRPRFFLSTGSSSSDAARRRPSSSPPSATLFLFCTHGPAFQERERVCTASTRAHTHTHAHARFPQNHVRRDHHIRARVHAALGTRAFSGGGARSAARRYHPFFWPCNPVLSSPRKPKTAV